MTKANPPAASSGAASAQVDVVVAVVRLLAIAVAEVNRHRTVMAVSAEDLPDYRSWPMLEVPRSTKARTIKLYVCPQGVLTTDDDPFPIGTQFVMERPDALGRDVFLLHKCAALYRSEGSRTVQEIWTSARYVSCEGPSNARAKTPMTDRGRTASERGD